MKIQIGDKLEIPSYKNLYEVVIEFMRGDADDYHKEFIKIKKEHEEELKDLLVVLKRCNDARSNIRFKDYNHVEGYKKYFGWIESEEEYNRLANIFITENNYTDNLINHPRDYNYDRYDTFDGFSVYYYDENGDKFMTKITY